MFIVSSDNEYFYPLRVYYPDLSIQFYTATQIGILNHATAGDGIMRTGVWFHVIVGANGSGCFGTFTKSNGTQYSFANADQVRADRETRVLGAYDLRNLTVSHM